MSRCRLTVLVMLLVAPTLETMPTNKLAMMPTPVLAMPTMTVPTMTMLLLLMSAMGPMLAMVLTVPMVWAVACCNCWCRVAEPRCWWGRRW